MARPTAREGVRKKATLPPLSRLPPPKDLTREQTAYYRRLGQLMVTSGTLTAMCLPMLEATARVGATLRKLYGDPAISRATLAAFARIHKEHLVQLGMGASALAGARPAASAEDREAERLGSLIE